MNALKLDTISTPDGTVILRLPRPGRFQVHVEATWDAPPSANEGGETRPARRAEQAPARPAAGCPTAIDEQIGSLRALVPGWYDGTGAAYAKEALDWLAKLLKGLVEGFRLPTPYLYPTPEGLARAEWPAADWEIVANIDLGARSAEVLAARADGNEVHELPVTFGEPGAESALGRFLSDRLVAE